MASLKKEFDTLSSSSRSLLKLIEGDTISSPAAEQGSMLPPPEEAHKVVDRHS
jgi:hypothetical protein